MSRHTVSDNLVVSTLPYWAMGTNHSQEHGHGALDICCAFSVRPSILLLPSSESCFIVRFLWLNINHSVIIAFLNMQ